MWEAHHNPELVITDDGTGESVLYDLSTYDYVGLHKLMHRLGFALVDGGTREAAAVRPLAPVAGAAASAFAGQRARAPAQDDASSDTAASLPQSGADGIVLARVATVNAANGLRASIVAAIKAGDEVLAQGFVGDGYSWWPRALKAAGALACAAAILFLLCACAPSGAIEPQRLYGLSGAGAGRAVRAAARYTPLAPVPEALSPPRGASAGVDKNV